MIAYRLLWPLSPKSSMIVVATGLPVKEVVARIPLPGAKVANKIPDSKFWLFIAVKIR